MLHQAVSGFAQVSALALPKKYHRMATSTYDVHNACNLNCEGCSYFVTDRKIKSRKPSDQEYDKFFADEAERGVNYPIFSGAEPSLDQNPLHIAARYWQHGAVFTNGIKRIDPGLPFRVVVSVWSGREKAGLLRGVNAYDKALRTAEGDRRTIIFFTITRASVEDIPHVVEDCANRGIPMSFNIYSMTSEYRKRIEARVPNDETYYRFSNNIDNLALSAPDLERAHNLIAESMDRHPDTVLFTQGLNELMTRPQPMHEIDQSSGLAKDCAILSLTSHQSFNYDLTRDERKDCCAPDFDCGDCRVLGAALATLMMRQARQMRISPSARTEVERLREVMMALYYWDWKSIDA